MPKSPRRELITCRWRERLRSGPSRFCGEVSDLAGMRDALGVRMLNARLKSEARPATGEFLVRY